MCLPSASVMICSRSAQRTGLRLSSSRRTVAAVTRPGGQQPHWNEKCSYRCGTLGSTGGNRIYGNTGTDLRVDLDGGQLKAENNWWGDAAGLLPDRVTLDAGGNTVDAVPFLAADPGL